MGEGREEGREGRREGRRTYHGSVVAGEEEAKSNLTGGVRLQGLLDGDEVFQTLAHFESFDVQMA